EHGARRVRRLTLARAPGIRIGRTILRVHDATHPVAEEKPLTPPGAHAIWGAGRGGLLILLLIIAQSLNTTQDPSPNLRLLPIVAKSEPRRLFGQRASLGDLRPPQLRLVPLANADDFFKKAEGARRRVDQARVKEPAPGGLLSDFDLSD